MSNNTPSPHMSNDSGVDNKDYIALNAMLNIPGENNQIQFEYDQKAARSYFLNHVNPNTVFFYDTEEKLGYLIDNGYYDESLINLYSRDFVHSLLEEAYKIKFRFPTFLGAYKFYRQYALKTKDGKRYLERYEDRVCMNALLLAQGNEDDARRYMHDIIEGRFQPATPTFLNAGKARRGEYVSCFPPEALVSTIEGTVEIQNVREGDMVLSHDSMYHAVKRVIVNENDGNLFAIFHHGSNSPLVLTDNHPVLVRSQRNLSPIIRGDGDAPERHVFWIQAKDVQKGDTLITPFPDSGNDESVFGSEVYDSKYIDDSPSHVYNLEVEDARTYTVGGIVVHNCFLLNTSDNMESIGNTVTSSLQLSKRGGGVGICLTSVRAAGDPIKDIENQASGNIPVMKLLEDSFSYANQLGARQGAGAVYISIHHPDVMTVLDSKRENADEKIRIKTLSIGLVVTDKLFELARAGEDLYQFSPYDVERVYGVQMSDISISQHYDDMVEDTRIRKTKISARKLLTTIAQLQFESGYPYLLFEDTANEFHNINGRINMSNLCSEILQINSPASFSDDGFIDKEGRDISCNLGSLNVAKAMRTGDYRDTVSSAIRALTAVSDLSDIRIVPNVRNGNEKTHSIGLGAMNLHGFLGSEKIMYGSEESLDFANVFFAAMKYHALSTSSDIAQEKGESFYEFEKSDYFSPDGSPSKALDKYTSGVWRTTPQTQRILDMFEEYGQWYPSQSDWIQLDEKIQRQGLYSAYLMANAPTGSISYISSSTPSVHPVASRVETRKEGKVGRVYHPSPGMTNDNYEFFPDAYELGYKPLVDMYAVINKHVDQSSSLTMFFTSDHTTRDLNKAYMYAWSKKFEKNAHGEVALDSPETAWRSGIVKTLYYSRVRSKNLEGTEIDGIDINACTSCMV